VEPVTSNCSEDTKRASFSHSDHTLVADSDMVPIPANDSSTPAAVRPSPVRASTNRPHLKRPARESALVADCLEHKIRRIEASGADATTSEIIMRGNPKRYLRYAQVQAKFKAWCREREIDWADPSGAPIINFLAFGRENFQWKVSTLESYRSSILDLFDNRLAIRESYIHTAFFQAVLDQTVREDRHQPVDISPILAYFEQLGSNDMMPLAELTKKLCWLLGLCGLLRPSDIERVNLEESDWTSDEDSISLMIVCPKEKRLGQRIKKTVVIHSHSQVHLCPVAAFRAYIKRHAHRPCKFPHPVLPHVNIHYLIRSISDCHRPIHAERISNWANAITALLPQGPSRPRLRLRALGATRAVLAGAPVDAVVAHGHWSSEAIFNNFYRLSSKSHIDFTSLIMSATEQDTQTLEPQSQDPLDEV
jgi:hypothetical protein